MSQQKLKAWDDLESAHSTVKDKTSISIDK
jgi:hypothetical protein